MQPDGHLDASESSVMGISKFPKNIEGHSSSSPCPLSLCWWWEWLAPPFLRTILSGHTANMMARHNVIYYIRSSLRWRHGRKPISLLLHAFQCPGLSFVSHDTHSMWYDYCSVVSKGRARHMENTSSLRKYAERLKTVDSVYSDWHF